MSDKPARNSPDIKSPVQEGLHRIVIRNVRNVLRSQQVLILVAAALIGVAAAYGAILFRLMILWVQKSFFYSDNPDLTWISQLPWYWKLSAPVLGGLLLGPIVVRLAPEARGSGIPEVIESVALHGGAVRKRVAPLKALAAAISIGSGGSAGREGPIVHIGAAIGSWVAQVMRVSVKQMRTFVGCGVAGGIAATFNTPFAGALFALEVVLGDLGTVRISPIVIASVVATVVSRHYAGDFPHIAVPGFYDDITVFNIWPYFVIGIACGFIAALFIRTLGWGWRLSNKWSVSPYLLPAFGGLIVGAIGIYVPEVFGVGYDTVNDILNGNLEWWFLGLILFLKIVATSATLTTGGSGGVFAPSLFMGAAIGGIIGGGVLMIAPWLHLSPHGFVLVGMGALVAGTTRAPISAVLVIFEMTNHYSIILPLMAACIPSVLISSKFHRDSIYLAKLTSKGVQLKPRGEVNVLKGIHVADVMARRVEVVSPGLALGDLVDRFLNTRFPILWMTDDKNRLLGSLESRNLQIAMLEREALLDVIVAADIAGVVEAKVHPDEDLSLVMKLFTDTSGDILPVVDRASGEWLGDLQRDDVLEAYNREIETRDLVGTTVDAINLAERLGSVDLGEGYGLMEYEVPAHMLGRTLMELDLRRKAGVQVVLLKRGGSRFVPGPDTAMSRGDILVLAGEVTNLEEKLRQM